MGHGGHTCILVHSSHICSSMERIREKDFENTQDLLRQSITSGVGGGVAWNGYMNVAQHNHKQSINDLMVV